MFEDLTVLCLLAGGAAGLPFVARRFSVPSAVLEILFGIALFALVTDHRPEWFHFMKELGFIYLMFTAGMELDLKELLKSTHIWWYLAIPSAAFVIAPLFATVLGHSYYVGIALSMVSAGIVLPVLKEAGMARTDEGRHIMGVSLAGELVSIAVLTGLDVYTRFGLSLLMAAQAGKLLLFLLLAGVTLRVIYLLAWWHPAQVKKVMASEDPIEEGIRIAILIVFTGALIAHSAGVEPIVGSFIAGVIFTWIFRNRTRFEEKINALGFGFFIPLFFIGVGADFDAGLLLSARDVLFSAALGLGILLCKAPVLIFAGRLGLDTRQAVRMALLLSAPLSMMVVAGTIGARMGIISSELMNILILAALLASLLYPFLFRRLVPAGENRETGTA